MIAINGRFLSARQSGVQRVARNLVVALDRSLGEGGNQTYGGVELHIPKGTVSDIHFKTIGLHDHAVTSGQVWEQLEFGSRSPRARLINFCNAGPVFKNSAVTMIHDAQIYITPESYSKAFVGWYKFMLPRLVSHSDLILTVSYYSRSMLVEYGVVPDRKIKVIHNGVDHILDLRPDYSVSDQLGISGKKFVVAFGSSQAHKNSLVLLKAFADPRLVDVTLVLIGGLSAHLAVEQLGFRPTPNVTFAGPISDEKVRALMERAVCLAHPAITEGFGLPPLEAMILGCPAVVANAGALPEVCRDGASYADPYDVDGWVLALRALVDEGNSRTVRVARARAVASLYRWNDAVAQLRDAIAPVV